MTMNAATRRRMMGLGRLASELESWCGFSVSSTSAAQSWPAPAAESAKGGDGGGGGGGVT